MKHYKSVYNIFFNKDLSDILSENELINSCSNNDGFPTIIQKESRNIYLPKKSI